MCFLEGSSSVVEEWEMCIQGGYKTQTVMQIANVISAYDAKTLSLRAVRVYLAALVSVASREAAKRFNKGKHRGRGVMAPKFLLTELARLTALSMKVVRRELRTLERVGLMTFGESEILFESTPRQGSEELRLALAGNRSEKRPVPLPRTLLRFLAKTSKASTIKAALAYTVRGLTLGRTGEVKGKGSVKATWIADTMGISERSARSARSELLKIGFITDDEGSTQLKLNRTGAYFTINLSFRAKEFAPLEAKKTPIFAPPYKDKKTYFVIKHQKAQSASPLRPSGVCIANTGNQKQKQVKNNLPAPNIKNVRTEDLKSFSRVEELYTQAVKCRLIEPTEAGAINFIGAAVRAMAVPGDAPRVFMGIIRGKLWKNITQRDEDRALAALRRHRESDPERFRFSVEQIRAAA